jgi:hypothetical protein
VDEDEVVAAPVREEEDTQGYYRCDVMQVEQVDDLLLLLLLLHFDYYRCVVMQVEQVDDILLLLLHFGLGHSSLS